MDLFDMLETPVEKPEIEVIDPRKPEISDEIKKLLQSHGYEISSKAAEDLADLFCFPPPWAPWAN